MLLKANRTHHNHCTSLDTAIIRNFADMKYLVGGSTGLLKQVETAERSVECWSPLEEQDLERQVTCMCWSGGKGYVIQL